MVYIKASLKLPVSSDNNIGGISADSVSMVRSQDTKMIVCGTFGCTSK